MSMRIGGPYQKWPRPSRTGRLSNRSAPLIPISPPTLQTEGRFGFEVRWSHDLQGESCRKGSICPAMLRKIAMAHLSPSMILSTDFARRIKLMSMWRDPIPRRSQRISTRTLLIAVRRFASGRFHLQNTATRQSLRTKTRRCRNI